MTTSSERSSLESVMRGASARSSRVVTPRLRRVLYVVFALVALLGANAAYLASVTALEWFSGKTFQNFFYQYMFLAHLALGLLLVVPFLVFGFGHMWLAKNRRNKWAIRIGYALLAVSLVVLVTGFLLMRVGGFDLRQPLVRSVVYWLHVVLPLVAAWLYWLHRLSGPRIKWKVGLAYAVSVGLIVLAMMGLHSQDPRDWYAVGPDSGTEYFEPSLARTSSGKFISAGTLMNDDYCKSCHADVHAAWSDSVHRFSSFNNPPYLASVHQTRQVSLERDGSVQAARWCAGCHDPVPFFSGAFDDPKFDLVGHPTSQAGITCTVCHAITHVNSVRGNADYTIEEPLHYPFAFSDNRLLKWVNHQLVKAKPEFHKKTFLKPFHSTAEFCSTCHKVHLPFALNHYKEFLRGQNHYDSYLLSGVSGHGARSFYYPPEAQENCNGCHMPLHASDDFGAQAFDGSEHLSVHDHLFPSANTGIAWLRDRPDIIAKHQAFLADNTRVDIFGVREEGEIDGKLIAPLRPVVPALEPGQSYLLETVIRTLKLGHHFTQGTVDSNEIWLDVTVTSGDRILGESGKLDAEAGNQVDPWAHFVNVFMLDRHGNQIQRRNAEDIFTPLYNHQIPPGAGQTVHYRLDVPQDVTEPIVVEVKLQYRKFNQSYMQYVADVTAELGAPIRGYEEGKPYRNDLPITTMAVDRVTFPVASDDQAEQDVANENSTIPEWQRWNDYGIGLLLKGKGELRQATEAFTQVEALDRWDGPLNLARTYNTEGRIDEAVAALQRATAYQNEAGYPRWTWAWLSGVVNRQQGRLDEAASNLRSVIEDDTAETRQRKFDFSQDIQVLNLLGQTLFDLGRIRQRQGRDAEVKSLWDEAIARFEQTLQVDPEDVTAHHNLHLLFAELGREDEAQHHASLHARYKADDNAQGEAVRLARQKYPAANKAAEAVVIYALQPQPEREASFEQAEREESSSAANAPQQSPTTISVSELQEQPHDELK